MSSNDTVDPRPIHFVGIAGAGMRALAELLTRRGVAVTGCDAHLGSVTDLEALGISVASGHSPDHVVGTRELIVTSAMPKNHPELARASELGVPITRRAEAIVLCDDDSGARSLAVPPSAEVIRYGLKSRDARLVASKIKADGHETAFSVAYDGEDLGDVGLHVPGNHNVLNALAAIGVGLSLGLKLDAMREGLSQFRGVDRRFQRLCDVAGIIIVDDYAHHPTEIASTLQAARASYPGRRIVAAFQPHLFSRTRDFSREFGSALAAAHGVVMAGL